MAKAYDEFGRGAGGDGCCPEWRPTGWEAVEALTGAAVEAWAAPCGGASPGSMECNGN
jgi:hypothetical protein